LSRDVLGRDEYELGRCDLYLLLVRALDLRHLVHVYEVVDIVVDYSVEEDPRVPRHY